jgi:hypothetical protein
MRPADPLGSRGEAKAQFQKKLRAWAKPGEIEPKRAEKHVPG